MRDDSIAEAALLGACLSNTKAPLIAAEYVRAEDFSAPKHGLIFAATLAILARGGNPDPVSVIADAGAGIENYGGASYIFSLPQLCPSVGSVREYANAVKEAALDRALRKAVTGALEQHEGNALLSALQGHCYQLDHRVQQSSTMAAVWKRMRARGTNAPPAGCSYPWEKIQYLTRGMRPGWLCILAGEATMGKTAAALEIAHYNLRDGKTVAVVSQEMGDEEIGLRMAQRQGFETDRYYKGLLTPEDMATLDAVAEPDYWARMHIDRVEKTGQLALVLRRWKPDLLIVDHLQLLAGAEKVETLSANTRELKLMAERYAVPILCLSQLSRGEQSDHERLPRLSRLRGSGTIEQDADTVVFVARKRGDNEELTEEAKLVVAKSRMGKTGGLRCRFIAETQTFVPYEEWRQA